MSDVVPYIRPELSERPHLRVTPLDMSMGLSGDFERLGCVFTEECQRQGFDVVVRVDDWTVTEFSGRTLRPEDV